MCKKLCSHSLILSLIQLVTAVTMGEYKKFLRTICKTVLVLTFTLSNIFPEARAHKTPAYSHESYSHLDNSWWLASISNDTPIFAISLPGTHETLSRGYGTEISECQTLSLETQLKAGIRVIDVRCRHCGDTFAIHHGIIYLHIMFGDVLEILEKFLTEYPSETILMRVKEEYSPVNVTRTFEETFETYYKSKSDLFWHPNSTTSCEIPSLGEVRGKVVVLDDFSHSCKYGLNYFNSGQFVIQDHYKFSTNWDLYKKWELSKKHIVNADKVRRAGMPRFFMNYLSGSYGALPYFVASGHIKPGSSASRLSTGLTTITSPHTYPDFPRTSCFLHICTISFEGTNVLAMQFLQQNQEITYAGIIMADYPGDGLITEVINLNKRHQFLLHNQPIVYWWSILFIVLSGIIFLCSLIYFIISVIQIRRRKARELAINNIFEKQETVNQYKRFR